MSSLNETHERKMDFINLLPIEIVENIISYLNGEDVLRCCQVCSVWRNFFNKERTWCILSREKGWLKDEEETVDSWHDHYWLNYNWKNGICKRHYHVAEGGGLQLGLNGQLVIISEVLTGSQMMSFDDTPEFHQNIFCDEWHLSTLVCGQSIVIRLHNDIRLYIQKKQDLHYKLIKVISGNSNSKHYDSELNLKTAIIHTGCNRLVVVQKGNKGHKALLWNLWNGFKYKPLCIEDVNFIFKGVLDNNKFYLVVVYQNEYRIRIYDLKREYQMSEITAFKNIAFGVIPPELQVNDKLIVAFCPTEIGTDLCYTYSPIKVWDPNGNVIGSVILNSERIDYFAVCLSNDFVIYRHSETVVKVWKPVTDEDICSFTIERNICQIDKAVGDLLVISYEKYFDVWDYKQCIRLYRVLLKGETYLGTHNRVKINKYYYAKRDRNKKSVIVFSFMNHLSDKGCDNIFSIPDYPLPFVLKSIM